MDGLTFLPDREGWDNLADTTGLVRYGTDSSALNELADRLMVEQADSVEMNETSWRALLALALLYDTWADSPLSLRMVRVERSTSPYAAWVLDAQGVAEGCTLAVLKAGETETLLGVTDPEWGLRPSASLTKLPELPERVTWFDAKERVFHDPTPLLNERDRETLIRRLRQTRLTSPQISAFISALAQQEQPLAQAIRQGDSERLEELAVRMQAVMGLADFEGWSVREEPYLSGTQNPLLVCFASNAPTQTTEMSPQQVWSWQGVPYARTSALLGLAPTGLAGEEEALKAMRDELAVMNTHSTRWAEETARRLSEWLENHQTSRSLLPAVRSYITLLRDALAENARQVQSTVTLNWPWDTNSGAVRALLRENMDDTWLTAAANPFADRLTRVQGSALTDRALRVCCAWSEGEGCYLPPLSADMARCVSEAEEGAGLALDALRYLPDEEGGVTASLLLRGKGEMRFTRHYAAEEIVTLSPQEAPAVAVWPCVPLQTWRAFYVFVRGAQVQVEALCGGEWTAVEETPQPWRVLRVERYPACLLVTRDGLSLGALPNTLPAMRVEEAGDAVAALDIGASGAAVALRLDGQTRKMDQRPLTRTLLAPQTEEADALLTELTLPDIVPTAVRLAGEGQTLFVDGQVYQPTSVASAVEVEGAGLCAALKWRADEASVRARSLLMHQLMLNASLQARLAGARSICWRAALADAMGEAGRSAFSDTLEALAPAVAEETGLPLTAGAPAVSCALESTALCALARGGSSAHGSFAALDLGGGSTKVHLWLRGKAVPVAGAVVLEGSQALLMKGLTIMPDALMADVADCGDEAIRRDAEALCLQLHRAGAARQADKTLLMLDTLLSCHGSELLRHFNLRAASGRPAYTQALVLEYLAGSLLLVGILLEQVGSDHLINHALPEDLTLQLSGRGSLLLTALPATAQEQLSRILRLPMRMDHPVRRVHIQGLAEPKLALAEGLLAMKETPEEQEAPSVGLKASFSGLMLKLMRALCAAFPLQMWLLHPGLFDPSGALTAAGEDTIRRVAGAAFEDGEDIPTSVLRFLSLLRAAPVEEDMRLSPGE